MKILGWILLVLNIIGLFLFVYFLQTELRGDYLLATGLALAQIIYISKTLRILQQFETIREKLDQVTRKAGLRMTKISAGEKGGKER